MRNVRNMTEAVLGAIAHLREVNYWTGATAMAQQEIALTQRSIYRKPSQPFTLWNPPSGRDWSEARTITAPGPDADEEDPIEPRDAGSDAVLVDDEDEPEPVTMPRHPQLPSVRKDALDEDRKEWETRGAESMKTAPVEENEPYDPSRTFA